MTSYSSSIRRRLGSLQLNKGSLTGDRGLLRRAHFSQSVVLDPLEDSDREADFVCETPPVVVAHPSKAARHGLVFDGACLPSASAQPAAPRRRQLSAAEDERPLDTTSLPLPITVNTDVAMALFRRAMTEGISTTPTRGFQPSLPKESKDAVRPFARSTSMHLFGRKALPSLSAEPSATPCCLSEEEVLEEFYEALDPARHGNQFSNFWPVFDRLTHDEFIIHTASGASKDKAQWATYWELLVLSGARMEDLQFLRSTPGEVHYTVSLVVGATVLELSHTVQFKEGRLVRINETAHRSFTSPVKACEGNGRGVFRCPGARPFLKADDPMWSSPLHPLNASPSGKLEAGL